MFVVPHSWLLNNASALSYFFVRSQISETSQRWSVKLLWILQWELATNHWFLNWGIISKFCMAGFLIFGLVFVSSDFELGRNVSCIDCQSHRGLIYCLFIRRLYNKKQGGLVIMPHHVVMVLQLLMKWESDVNVACSSWNSTISLSNDD